MDELTVSTSTLLTTKLGSPVPAIQVFPPSPDRNTARPFPASRRSGSVRESPIDVTVVADDQVEPSVVTVERGTHTLPLSSDRHRRVEPVYREPADRGSNWTIERNGRTSPLA